MTSYGLTDIEDVGLFIQNNEKTINGLNKTEGVLEKGGKGREILTSSIRPKLTCSPQLSLEGEATGKRTHINAPQDVVQPTNYDSLKLQEVLVP